MPGENLRKTGSEMEEAAAQFLEEHGVRILERNFRSREAEIDIIGKDGETLIFVEVKARKAGKKSGEASEAVGTAKQKRICGCADFYMHEKGIDPFGAMIRFDVVAIKKGSDDKPEHSSETCKTVAGSETKTGTDLLSKNNHAEIHWIRNAFFYIPYGRVKPHWRVW